MFKEEKGIDDDASEAGSAAAEGSKKKSPKSQEKVATLGETFGFAFETGTRAKIAFVLGTIGGIGNGMVYPGIGFIFSRLFADLTLASTNGLGPLANVAYALIGLGFYALIMATLQTACFEAVAFLGAENLRKKWFKALLRQDQAFFDVHDVGGIANSVNPSVNKYRRGLGRKLGEGIEFFSCTIFGFIYAMYEEWRVALVVLSFSPAVVVFALGVVKLNQTKTSRAQQCYSKAGSVAYSTVSGIKTVLSLNAAPTMIEQYKEATQDAFNSATRMLVKQGIVNGSMMGAFLFMYVILTLYGVYTIYQDVIESGCDPSTAVFNNESCESSGPRVLGAMFGIAFAGQGISQVGNALEIFSSARVAAGEAMTAINRTPGHPEEKIYHVEEEGKKGEEDDESVTSSRHSGSSFMIESPEGRIKAILPPYEIDSMTEEGVKPESIKGKLSFEEVEFRYPTRPGQTVLQDLSVDIPAGKTFAFVGPSGGGKSTVVKLLERFYDPTAGSVKLDGIDLKDINVKYLRSMIGYVGQEPALFATTIGKNIGYGLPDCTQEQIEEAAKQANAHDFIMQLPDGYDTDVGDKGSQLSGGQKQRIAIARVLISDPKILLLDEATSALDSQSELVVQEALEKIIKTKKRTTVIIAHRLSTIRNADTIAVVMGGKIVEKGKHDKLMKKETYYKKLVESQGQTAMAKRNSSIVQTVDGQTESQRGFEKVPAELVDMDGKPLFVFRNVNFTYPTRPSKMILDRFKLKIYKGETIGLCGISGGGKSTVMGLIERFYDPDSGSIEYYGEDLKDLNVKWYRDQIGYVGQEPLLFEATIAENIAYGAPGATREEIIEAAKQANAYDFIMKFPQDFDTPLSGGAGTELSGGQKQRVAIARAIVKQPPVLLLDEATSALDNESERIVQEALNELMESRDRTCIVIAHRLSTIRNSDRIAFIGDGRVKEIGSHDELMEKKNGKYKRLVESQGRTASTLANGFDSSSKKKKKKKNDTDTEETDTVVYWEDEILTKESNSFNISRARRLAAPDAWHMLVGALGALMAGSVFPSWGIMFAETIELLYQPIFVCDGSEAILALLQVSSCDEYSSDDIAQDMRDRSYTLSVYWTIIIIVNGIGNVLLYWGFGHATERLSRRIRNVAFDALVRQEVAFFDKRSVGKITSELQEDTTQIQTFTGDPIRQLLISSSSVLVGLVVAFYYMWPFALFTILCLPFLGWAQSLELEKTMGTDEKEEGDEKLDLDSPGGIAVETLLNMGTVSALALQDKRYIMYEEALENSDKDWLRLALKSGVLSGLSMGIQQWINACLFLFGGWLITKYPEAYDFNDFLTSMFALLFGLFGLGLAFQDVADRKETEKSASRIFYLLDRKSEIDPLSDEGRTVDYSIPMKSKAKKKKSVEKPKSEKKKRLSLKNVAEEEPEDIAFEDEGDEHKKRSSSSKKKSRKSSKKLLDESGDGSEKKPKSSKKKKKSKKKDSLPKGESEDIVFFPPDAADEGPPADVFA